MTQPPKRGPPELTEYTFECMGCGHRQVEAVETVYAGLAPRAACGECADDRLMITR
jgi:transcription elongation factor Elf1